MLCEIRSALGNLFQRNGTELQKALSPKCEFYWRQGDYHLHVNAGICYHQNNYEVLYVRWSNVACLLLHASVSNLKLIRSHIGSQCNFFSRGVVCSLRLYVFINHFSSQYALENIPSLKSVPSLPDIDVEE